MRFGMVGYGEGRLVLEVWKVGYEMMVDRGYSFRGLHGRGREKEREREGICLHPGET